MPSQAKPSLSGVGPLSAYESKSESEFLGASSHVLDSATDISQSMNLSRTRITLTHPITFSSFANPCAFRTLTTMAPTGT